MVKRFLNSFLCIRGATSTLALVTLLGCSNLQLAREPISISDHSSAAQRYHQMVRSKDKQDISRLVAVGRFLIKRKINFSMAFDDTIKTQPALSIGGIGVVSSPSDHQSYSIGDQTSTLVGNVATKPHVWSQSPASYPPPVMPYVTFDQYQNDQTSKLIDSPARAASKAW